MLLDRQTAPPWWWCLCAVFVSWRSKFYTIPTLKSYKTGGFGIGKKMMRQVPMTKNVKVVKNIKKSVRVFVIFVPLPFIYVGINIYYVEHRILQLLGQTVPHRMKTSHDWSSNKLVQHNKTTDCHKKLLSPIRARVNRQHAYSLETILYLYRFSFLIWVKTLEK
jgi:hypothetical protein